MRAKKTRRWFKDLHDEIMFDIEASDFYYENIVPYDYAPIACNAELFTILCEEVYKFLTKELGL